MHDLSISQRPKGYQRHLNRFLLVEPVCLHISHQSPFEPLEQVRHIDQKVAPDHGSALKVRGTGGDHDLHAGEEYQTHFDRAND